MTSKTWLFKVILYLIPILFFVGLEFGLRLANFGKSVPLFIENPAAPHYLLPKPDVVTRYFADEGLAPNVTIEPNFFLKDKPADGIRIFVQGGSTAAGFPYGLGASIAGMLDYRLKQTFPEQTVEVVNTALSAVNSYTLLDFADEIIEQSPDAIMIYAGHNEYLGIMGVGSNYTAANSRGATLLFLKLKNLRIFQLMQRAYYWFATPQIVEATGQSRTVMAKVAKHKNIEADSELFKAGLEQFEGNISLLLAKYQKAKIPVFISTIGSNLVDHAPFESKRVTAQMLHDYIHQYGEKAPISKHVGEVEVTELSEETKNNIDTHANSNINYVDTHRYQNYIDSHPASFALDELASFLERFDDSERVKSQSGVVSKVDLIRLNLLSKLDSANAHFWLGSYWLNHKEIETASYHFEQARQHDLLRFRAPQEINNMIDKLAIQFGAHVVDGNLALKQASVHNIIDGSVMLEHLHPNSYGYFAISDSFYHEVEKSGIFGDFPNSISRSRAKMDLPLLKAEEYWGAAKIAGLMADYPFRKVPQKMLLPKVNSKQDGIGLAAFNKKIGWLGLAKETQKLAGANNDTETFLRVSKLLADAVPNDISQNFTTGVQHIQAKQPLEAIRFLRRVLLENPKHVNALLAMAHVFSDLGRLNQAVEKLNEVLKIDSKNQTALDNLAAIKRYLD